MATKEKYGKIIKEKKLFEDKERILLNAFDALKELFTLKTNSISKPLINSSNEDNVVDVSQETIIDITGEDANGGSSSQIIKCGQCSFKTTIPSRLNEHKRKHHSDSGNELNIKCDECEFVGNADIYLDHMKKGHGKQSNNKQDNVTIPCDLCKFVSKSTSDYLKHIETHNSEKRKVELTCDICDKKVDGQEAFKVHIEDVHGLKVRHNEQNREKVRFLCILE